MNIAFIEKISKRYPFLARTIELSIISGAIYVGGAVITGDPLNQQAIAGAFLTPILAGLSKLQRDLKRVE